MGGGNTSSTTTVVEEDVNYASAVSDEIANYVSNYFNDNSVVQYFTEVDMEEIATLAIESVIKSGIIPNDADFEVLKMQESMKLSII